MIEYHVFMENVIPLLHQSWKKNINLRHKQKALDLTQHRLISPVTTRWDSTIEMISHTVEQQQVISAVLASDCSKWHLMPSNDDFKLLETLVNVLKPLGILTDALSGEKQVIKLFFYGLTSYFPKRLRCPSGKGHHNHIIWKMGKAESAQQTRAMGVAKFLAQRNNSSGKHQTWDYGFIIYHHNNGLLLPPKFSN